MVSSPALFRFLAGLAVVACCLACGGSSVESESTPSSASASPQTFAGRHYSLRIPAGWQPRESSAVWASGTRPDPDQPGFDTFAAPESATFIAVASRDVRAGLTLAAWRQLLTREGALDYSECGAAGGWETDLLANEPALRLPLPCETHDVDAQVVLMVHNNVGWAVMCAVPHGATPGPQEACKQWLSGFTFRD